ncbi:MAG: SAM hydroxide adenosyltransferase [Candidatus Nanohaloarchaea archaeon]
MDTLSVPPFNTVAAGFVLEQLGFHIPNPDNFLIYANVAPRDDSDVPRKDNEGEPLVFVRLENDVPIVTTRSGFILSFVKPWIEEAREMDVKRNGSQFRSRDIFPEAVERVLKGEEQEITSSQLDPDEIPDRPEYRIAYIDGFGNLKTTIRESEVEGKHGKNVEVCVNGRKMIMERADGIFGVEPRDKVFAPGSSGGSDPYMEIVKRGASVESEIGGVEPGDRIQLR